MRKRIAKMVGVGLVTAIAFLMTTTNAFAYTVEPGDTMSEIAYEHELSLFELIELNPQIVNVNLIFPGEYIETELDGKVITQHKTQPQSKVIQKPATQQPVIKQPTGRTLTVEATAYSTNQPSLSDFTFTGINLRKNPNVIAVDPNVIPLCSKVYVPGFGVYIAGDTGGAIKGNRIDIHITNLDAAWKFGRQTMTIEIVE